MLLQIYRVQNPELYIQYQAHKRRVAREMRLKGYYNYKGVTLERELWHGTTRDVMQAICSQEFNRSYSGSKHGINTLLNVVWLTPLSLK